MKNTWFPALLVLGISSAAACQNEGRAPADGKASRATSTAPAPAPSQPPARRTRLTIRLEHEAASRPELAVRPESLFSQLAHDGVELLRTQQVLGVALGARYCQVALTRHGLGISVCEFASDDDAERGIERSHAAFDRLVPGRRMLRNGQTLLTLTPAAVEASERESQFAESRFGELHPEHLGGS